MRFNVDRICELAGIGAATGGLLSEAAAAPTAKPAAPAAKAPAEKPVAAAAKPVPAAKAAAPAAAPKVEEEADLDDAYSLDEMGADHMDDGYHAMEAMIDDDEMYEIDEIELMEALVDMRQQRLEESSVRDTVRDEIKRALGDKSGSWVYGAQKPTASREGQIARGGFGIGFGFKR